MRKKKCPVEDSNVKEVKMTIPEFINFRTLAFSKHVDFNSNITHGIYHVQCESQFMQAIGY